MPKKDNSAQIHLFMLKKFKLQKMKYHNTELISKIHLILANTKPKPSMMITVNVKALFFSNTKTGSSFHFRITN